MNIATAILTRLIGRASADAETVAARPDGGDPLRLNVHVLSDRGCQRAQNEDCGCYLTSPSGHGTLVLIADGMGGHRGGEMASRLAAEVIGERYIKAARQQPQRVLQQAFRAANRRIYRAGRRNRDYRGMGTTCTVLWLHGAAAYVAHVGDSRLYLVRDDAIYRLTEDHSLVMEMVKHGLLNHQQAGQHQDKNVILRALGTKPKLEISVWQRPLPVQDGDRFLLSTDGLHDLVSDAEIKTEADGKPPHQACEELIELAKRRGGYDNITVGVVDVGAASRTAAGVSDHDRAA